MGPSGKKVLYLNNISVDMCLLPSVLCVCLDLNCHPTTALRCSMLKSHVHPAQYVDGVRTSMLYLQTTCSVDLVIVLFRVDNTCHRSCDLVTRHTLCCI